MLELRILHLFENINSLDPLTSSIFSTDELSELCDQNEINAAKDSLNSELIHWKDGKKVICKEWIQNLLSELSPIAEKFNMKYLLKPIYKVIAEGNQSMKWIDQYHQGLSIEKIMKTTIDDMIMNEDESI
jgi:predicted glutamate--cysteine ligase